MTVQNIIVQAGGKGSRMQSLTRNKPKALVPVDNLPMIFHLFKHFPDKHFIVIGDYKYEVLERYLNAFAEDVDYELICATGKQGTCAGLSFALELIEDKTSFLLIWCDLVLPAEYRLPKQVGNYVGISKDFQCRWSYKDGNFEEIPSAEQGVAGFFIFEDKKLLCDMPQEGELVKYLAGKNISFAEEPLYHTHEYGLKSEWLKLPVHRCRPFNEMEIQSDILIKRPIDEMGKTLARREEKWYQRVGKESVEGVSIPEIYGYQPLRMERIQGKNIYEYDDIPYGEKRHILESVVTTLKRLHKIGSVPTDKDSFREAYIDKTLRRLEKVRELVPFAHDEFIVVNGRKCRNVFYHIEEIEKQLNHFVPDSFCFIHGDCTFSNILLKDDHIPVLIDPRDTLELPSCTGIVDMIGRSYIIHLLVIMTSST